ncbi:MAG TPA: tetratricopeptide repeat protein [Bryobacteraceae bacterium]|nr:tetratricopeptide repeat protein [Bryobacteraceae bacterium]
MIRLAKAVLFLAPLSCALLAQTAPAPADTNAPDTNKAGAYYNFAMGRLYTELAASEGRQSDYVAKAIQHYKEALKLDPSASIVFEELTDLYIQTGRLREATTQAEEMLKQNPDNLDARRMLGRIYTRALGDNSTGRVDETNLKRAMEQYQKITEKDPKDADSWVMLGRLYRVSNNTPDAEKAFNAALQADPENEDALTQMAVMYAELGDSKRAIEKLQAATSKSPNERSLALLADQYEQLQDYKSAAEVLRRAMELAPDNGRIARGLAQDLMYSDQLDEALKLYTQLATDEPRDPSLPLHMAEIYRAQHDYTKAREFLSKAKSLGADGLEVRYQDIKILEAEGKTDQALSNLKAILDETQRNNYPEAEARRRASLLEEYGAVSRSAKKFPQAIEAFRQMAAVYGDSEAGKEAGPRAEVQIIETYRQSRDFEGAMKEADSALKKYPEERMIKVEHATALADLGKTDAAAAEVRGLMKGDKDRETLIALAQVYEKGKRFEDMSKTLDEVEKLTTSKEDKVNLYFMRGAMFERMKKPDESEASFRKVLELDPDNAEALNYLGYMLADRNIKLDEAQKMIKKALDSEPENGAFLDSMGWVCFRQGKLDEAQGLLQRALDKIGQDPTVHAHLGDVYFKLGKTREAITQWQASVREYQSGSQAEADPEELAKVKQKLDEAQVKLAQEKKK